MLHCNVKCYKNILSIVKGEMCNFRKNNGYVHWPRDPCKVDYTQGQDVWPLKVEFWIYTANGLGNKCTVI